MQKLITVGNSKALTISSQVLKQVEMLMLQQCSLTLKRNG